jgi:4-diphosphocytidyl-2C-methyl-D-erythritol kinase
LTPRENSITIFRFVSSDLAGPSRFRILANELEDAALAEAPILREQVGRMRELLVREGARFTALSGSGSTYFGLFDDAHVAGAAKAALVAAGFVARRTRTLSLDRYRRVWSRALAPAGANPGGIQG